MFNNAKVCLLCGSKMSCWDKKCKKGNERRGFRHQKSADPKSGSSLRFGFNNYCGDYKTKRGIYFRKHLLMKSNF